jgi:hypothetical protein
VASPASPPSKLAGGRRKGNTGGGTPSFQSAALLALVAMFSSIRAKKPGDIYQIDLMFFSGGRVRQYAGLEATASAGSGCDKLALAATGWLGVRPSLRPETGWLQSRLACRCDRLALVARRKAACCMHWRAISRDAPL